MGLHVLIHYNFYRVNAEKETFSAFFMPIIKLTLAYN